MGSATASAEWPSIPISKPVKELIDQFYSLADSKSPDIGARLANEIFTIDGILQNNDQRTDGHSCKKILCLNQFKLIGLERLIELSMKR